MSLAAIYLHQQTDSWHKTISRRHFPLACQNLNCWRTQNRFPLVEWVWMGNGLHKLMIKQRKVQSKIRLHVCAG